MKIENDLNNISDEKFSPFFAVIFGGDGDLAARKIYPAFFNRYAAGQLQCDFSILAISRNEWDINFFSARVISFISDTVGSDYCTNDELVQSFLKKIKLFRIPENSATSYNVLKVELEKQPTYQTIFYCSTPSSAFPEITKALKDAGLIKDSSKLVLEKPIGSSLVSAQQISTSVLTAFSEKQIYRIDHYLGKETVQNLMVLRFANNLFEKAWNRENIDNIQISVAENLGVETRASYYDKSGALLDMVQNHLLQLLCLVAMEPPYSLHPDAVRSEKLKVLHALRVFNINSVETDTVKGQYTRGKVNEKEVNSYLEDIGKYDSKTETFVALKTFVDNWRWKDIPFYLRTGKRMKKRYSEIVINFKSVSHNIFSAGEKIPNNRLIIRLQPQERIELVQMTKIPGPGGYRYKPISLKLDFMDSFKERLPEAYERLLIDIIRGNPTLFMTNDELEACWKWIESITESWKVTEKTNMLYEAGTWGPGNQILNEGHEWSTKEDGNHR